MALRTCQVAEFLAVKTGVVQKWSYRGVLKSTKHSAGKMLLFELEDVANFILNRYDLYLRFLNCKPRKAYVDSYHLLQQEVRKQYERKWIN